MQWSSGERERFFSILDGIERAVVVVCRVVLALIIVAVLVVVAVVIVRKPWGAGAQGEWFYFSIAVLLVLGWAVGQFIVLGRRQSAPRSVVGFVSNRQQGAHTSELRLGEAPQEDSSN